MGRTATRTQDARTRAREARWAFLTERSAQDARIEEATVAALLALEDRSAAQSMVEAAERAIAVALQQLASENLKVHDIAALIGLSEGESSRLLRMRANGPKMGPTAGTEAAADAAE
jgi:hypothetical protein